jgi:hypothetical protein
MIISSQCSLFTLLLKFWAENTFYCDFWNQIRVGYRLLPVRRSTRILVVIDEQKIAGKEVVKIVISGFPSILFGLSHK